MNTKSKHQQRSALIVGGSIAGLSAALALQQRGWDVNIYEATHGELEKRGAGIITHPSLFAGFDKLNITDREQIGVAIQTRKTFAKDGSVESTLDLPQIATSWGRTYQLLKNEFPTINYHQNKKLLQFELDDQKVITRFDDGTKHTGDLLVAADGIRSTIRNQLEPESNPEYAGYIAWRGLIDESDLSAEEQRELFPYFTFCLPDGEQVLTYPIAGKQHQIEPGLRRYNVVWYRPAAADTTLKELLTDSDGNNNGESIAPDKVRASVITSMQQDATTMLSPQHTRLIKRLHQPFIQPIYDLTTRSMIHDRVAIIGDAAFTARPHLGVGITKAVEDALSLAEALDSYADIPQALHHFDEQRRTINKQWVDRSRELGAYLQAQQMSADEKRHAQIHRTPEAVMRETASLSG